MFQPAAGHLLTREPVRRMTDRYVDLSTVTTLDGPGLTRRVRSLMRPDPTSPAAQADGTRGRRGRPAAAASRRRRGSPRQRHHRGRRDLARAPACRRPVRALRHQRAHPATPAAQADRARTQVADPSSPEAPGGGGPAARLRGGAGRHRGRPGLRRPGALHPRLPQGDRHDAGRVRRPLPLTERYEFCCGTVVFVWTSLVRSFEHLYDHGYGAEPDRAADRAGLGPRRVPGRRPARRARPARRLRRRPSSRKGRGRPRGCARPSTG